METGTAKEYKFGEHIFTMLPLDLDKLHIAAPVLLKYRKLQFQNTADIDMSEVEKVQDRLQELQDAIEDIEAEETPDEQRLYELKKTLETETLAFKNDAGLQKGIELYNDCEAMAIYELITDVKLMKPLVSGILKGDVKPETLDYGNPDIVSFLRDVINDFFLIIQKSKEELKI